MHVTIGTGSKRGAGALLAVLVLLAGAVALAEDAPKVDNPHGKLHEECATCHDAKGWKPAHISDRFDHARYGFPLTGAHSTSECMSCHTSLRFASTRTQCVSCHADPHLGELGTDCARCHDARSFIDRAPMARAHQMTRFPLTGAHAVVDCEDCHRPSAQGQMQFKGTPTDCASCHMAQYDGAKDPDHVAAGYPLTCQNCHGLTSWLMSAFDHSRTGFALTGAHATVACAQCHANNSFTNLPTDCASCHMAQFNAATPNHVSSGFPASQCATCHDTKTWSDAAFDHNTLTSFPLTGAHVGLACTQCHGDGVFKGKPTDCLSCHSTQFNAASPPHNPTNFPDVQCGTCHNTNAWAGGQLNHNDGIFALTGAHTTLSCTSCHSDGVYNAKPTDCASCHMTQYDAATPNHVTAGFPANQCAVCHDTKTWSDATFNHNDGIFPLTGAHTSAPCTSCHGDGVYAGKPTDCLSCHASNYAAAVPAHVSTFFPDAQCGTCHNTTAWTGGVISTHDASWFPIYSGHHQGRWSLCTDCHSTPPTYSQFTCTTACHPQSSTNNEHSGVNGYSYTSSACYSCHPRGSGG